ncbi:O-methyltransferase [Saccharomonospora iraqiensis]|uniref:O-methyltransferase n=1 Tax=Saccharomonospora iraqiensis TaxID=52698 RepID=UPI00040798CD|nr:O-methyltransferase [Saccharomonospora iraqiensis]
MTDQQRWAAVDDYVDGHLVGQDEVLDDIQRAADRAGLPPISVAANQGKLLHLLARTVGARRVLEIGTLAGYSTVWLARALPSDGRVVTIEAEPSYAELARANVERAGLGERIDIRVGAALDVLPTLDDEGPFDLTFVDADKVNNPHYVRHAVRLSRPGSLIVVDNVVRRGAVADATDPDPSVRGSREVIELLAADPRLDATAVQTVGTKGWDGLALALVTG